MNPRDLLEQIEKLLDGIADKPEMDRTKREEQLLELGRAFVDSLRRYARSETELNHYEEAVARVVKSGNEVAGLAQRYNAVNREYDLKDLDAEALSHFRKGK